MVSGLAVGLHCGVVLWGHRREAVVAVTNACAKVAMQDAGDVEESSEGNAD
mgnify:CR=1 FL=1